MWIPNTQRINGHTWLLGRICQFSMSIYTGTLFTGILWCSFKKETDWTIKLNQLHYKASVFSLLTGTMARQPEERDGRGGFSSAVTRWWIAPCWRSPIRQGREDELKHSTKEETWDKWQLETRCLTDRLPTITFIYKYIFLNNFGYYLSFTVHAFKLVLAFFLSHFLFMCTKGFRSCLSRRKWLGFYISVPPLKNSL